MRMWQIVAEEVMKFICGNLPLPAARIPGEK